MWRCGGNWTALPAAVPTGIRDETPKYKSAHLDGVWRGEQTQTRTATAVHLQQNTPITMMFSIFCVSSLLLLDLASAKPVSGLQSLKQFLNEEMSAPLDAQLEQKSAQVEPRADDRQWDSDPGNSALALERLLGDILSTPKRSWSRFKKGGLRSCFGVRLERIGSFSGLGC